MKFYIIFFASYFIHNSFAQQVPPLVTGRNLNHQQRHGHSNNQENDLSINSIRNELNANRLQLERIEYSNTQIVNAVKNYRYEMEEIKKSLNKVQAQCLENQVFASSDINNSSLLKLDSLQQLIITMRSSMQKIEREVIAVRKTSRKSHANYPMAHQRNMFAHDNEATCTASTENETGIKKMRKNFFIQCQLEDDGNWIVIQNRLSGDINFFRDWNDYKEGFGYVGGEFWMGLEKIHELTSNELHELMIIIEDFNGEKKIAKYAGFAVSSENGGYALNVLGKYSGDAGDAFTYHAGMKFSTYDVDNDEWSDGSCAKSHQGGWWFRQCDESNLNGLYFPNGENPTKSSDFKGMHWKHESNSMITLKSVKMMIRPVD